MQLRDHPLMCHHGKPNWPPIWSTPRHETTVPKGEVGTLELSLTHELFHSRIYLVMQFEGRRYMASVTFDDEAFCRQIQSVLQQHLGRSIKEIGDLEVDDTL